MVDIASKVFDTVYTAVSTAYPSARIDAGYVELPATFPAVTVMETNSVPVRRMNTDENSEFCTRLYYEVNIYSNKQDTARSEAREIAKTVDAAMKTLKFYRTMMHELPAQDRTITRLYLRYEVIVREIVNGNDIVYQFYRR